jgi:DNA polymerase-1
VYKFIELLMTHRTEAKMYGTYVKGIRKRLYGGRVYTSYRQHGSVTGRLASRNPNLLNIPRGSIARKLFIPAKPEFVMAQTDYSQAELRVLTWFAQEEYFRDIFDDPDRDIFDELTPELYPGATKESMSKADWKELRIRVKAFVYGLGYGRSAFSVAMEYKMSPDEGERMKNRFFSTIPKIVEFQDEVKRKLATGQDLITPYGRHRRFMLVTDESKSKLQNEALAFMPQSTASDMCLEAFVQVRQELKGIAYVRNVIYDAILYECHPDDLPYVSKVVETHMINSAEALVGGYVKFAVDTTYGKSWGDC